jgi:hypothetical protein
MKSINIASLIKPQKLADRVTSALSNQRHHNLHGYSDCAHGWFNDAALLILEASLMLPPAPPTSKLSAPQRNSPTLASSMVLISFSQKRVPVWLNLDDDNKAKQSSFQSGCSATTHAGDLFMSCKGSSMHLRWQVEQADTVAVAKGAEQKRSLSHTVHAE